MKAGNNSLVTDTRNPLTVPLMALGVITAALVVVVISLSVAVHHLRRAMQKQQSSTVTSTGLCLLNVFETVTLVQCLRCAKQVMFSWRLCVCLPACL